MKLSHGCISQVWGPEMISTLQTNSYIDTVLILLVVLYLDIKKSYLIFIGVSPPRFHLIVGNEVGTKWIQARVNVRGGLKVLIPDEKQRLGREGVPVEVLGLQIAMSSALREAARSVPHRPTALRAGAASASACRCLCPLSSAPHLLTAETPPAGGGRREEQVWGGGCCGRGA